MSISFFSSIDEFLNYLDVKSEIYLYYWNNAIGFIAK